MFTLMTNHNSMTFFTIYGLAVIILSIIPNIIFLPRAKDTRPDDIETAGMAVNLVEFWARVALTLMFIFMEFPHMSNYWLYVAIGIYVLYMILWIKFAIEGSYYPDIYLKKFLFIPVPIDILNVLFFNVTAIWLGSFFGLIVSIIYGVARILNATKAYKDLSTRI